MSKIVVPRSIFHFSREYAIPSFFLEELRYRRVGVKYGVSRYWASRSKQETVLRKSNRFLWQNVISTCNVRIIRSAPEWSALCRPCSFPSPAGWASPIIAESFLTSYRSRVIRVTKEPVGYLGLSKSSVPYGSGIMWGPIARVCQFLTIWIVVCFVRSHFSLSHVSTHHIRFSHCSKLCASCNTLWETWVLTLHDWMPWKPKLILAYLRLGNSSSILP